MEPQSCSGLAIQAVSKGYSFFTSAEGRALLASLAATRALISYCGRSSLVEARKLAYSLAGGLVLMGLLTAVELKLPESLKLAVSCASSGHTIAVFRGETQRAGSGARFGFEPFRVVSP